VIHLVTWLPLPYQCTLSRALSEAYGPSFVTWFGERSHKDFPYRSAVQETFVHHYLSEVGYGKFLSALRSDPEAVVVLCGWSSPMTHKTLLFTVLLRIPLFIWADHPHPRKRSKVMEFARKAFLRALSGKAIGFLACGKPTVEHLVSLGIKPAKISNFPYWVELPNEWSVPERCLNGAADFRPLRLLAIGRHVPSKHFEVAIKAVALANQSAGTPVVELVLAGDGPERGKLANLSQAVARDAKVRLTGWLETEEIHQEIRASDALITTSEFEPYGVVVLEAMACGRPVLASEGVVAARDRDEGLGAILLHPIGDVERLAKQVVSLASDRELLRAAALAARATAEKWAPNRAVGIINKLLLTTTQGRTMLKEAAVAAGEFWVDPEEVNGIEKASIAASGR